MLESDITAKLRERLGERVLAHSVTQGQESITIRPADLLEVASFLKSDPDISMEMLMDVGGVDYLGYGDDREWRYEVAYHFYSLSKNHRYRVKVAVEDDTVEVPTLHSLWRVSNWMEREVYDQYGLRFAGHKNLRRILNHDDFVGHPLRKDYPIQRRQKLSRPSEHLIPDDPEWA
jgi:NADH-quinone oxidoreductase subunit C